MIKYFRKAFAPNPPTSSQAQEESKDKSKKEEVIIPLKGVAKKRGKTFGFLQFSDLTEKNDFTELFSQTVAQVKRFRLREVTNKLDIAKGFRPVKAASEMANDAQRRKEEKGASVTQADIDQVLQESIEARVTPYADLPYSE